MNKKSIFLSALLIFSLSTEVTLSLTVREWNRKFSNRPLILSSFPEKKKVLSYSERFNRRIEEVGKSLSRGISFVTGSSRNKTLNLSEVLKRSNAATQERIKNDTQLRMQSLSARIANKKAAGRASIKLLGKIGAVGQIKNSYDNLSLSKKARINLKIMQKDAMAQFDLVKSIGKEYLNSAKEKVSKVVSTAQDSKAWKSVKANYSNAVSATKAKCSNTWNSAKANCSNAVSTTKAKCLNTWNSTKENCANVVNATKDKCSEAWNSTKSFGKDRAKNIKNARVYLGSKGKSAKTFVVDSLNNSKDWTVKKAKEHPYWCATAVVVTFAGVYATKKLYDSYQDEEEGN